jgi:outer membrane protein OmpA-like peptidoglycan-associated protein
VVRWGWSVAAILSASACSGAAETSPTPATPAFVTIESSCDIVLPGAFKFRAGSSTLEPDSAWLVDSYVSMIRTSCLKPERVAIVGFLAPSEPDAPGLAQARADAVSRAFVAHGVEPSRLETHGSPTRYPDEMYPTEGRAEIKILRAEGRDWMRWDGQAVVPIDP